MNILRNRCGNSCARDYEALRQASLELLELVEQIAGQARAASIAEQLQHLLQHSPQSTVH